MLVDWSAQPEAGFLLKRARESAPNENAVAIAIVEREPSAAEMRDQRLGLLIYRPVGVKEAQEVLAKARETMPEVAVPVISERRKATVRPQTMVAPPPVPPEQPSPDQLPPEDATFHAEAISPPAATPGLEPNPEITPEVEEGEAPSPSHRISLTTVAAVVLVFGALLCLWSARDTILYLASSQGRFNVLKDSVSALFSLNSSGSASAAPTGTDRPWMPTSTAASAIRTRILNSESSPARPRWPIRTFNCTRLLIFRCPRPFTSRPLLRPGAPFPIAFAARLPLLRQWSSPLPLK